jgi:hypothetical protein
MKSKQTTVFDCTLVDLPKIHNNAGNITVLEYEETIPFKVERIYYLYDIPGGEERGSHAHYQLEQYIIAASGSFDVVLDDGKNKKRFHLNRPNKALYLVPGLWRTLDNFSSGSICMVLASLEYNENDYIRNYEKYLAWKSEQ